MDLPREALGPQGLLATSMVLASIYHFTDVAMGLVVCLTSPFPFVWYSQYFAFC